MTNRCQVDEENIYHWNVALMVVNPDSMYYGGYFKATMNFPTEYPYKPPGRSKISISIVVES
jgi:ubiquitin-conjugating enzyme E2 R